MLDRSPIATLTERVMDWVRGRVASRTLGPGARLPSIRKFADMQDVSKSTIVEAYARLAAEGVITPRPGSGFYVTAHPRPLPLSEAGPQIDRVVDPLWVMRQSLGAN